MTGLLLVRVARRLIRAACVFGGCWFVLAAAGAELATELSLRATALPPQPAFELAVLGVEPAGPRGDYSKFVLPRGEPRALVAAGATWAPAKQDPAGLDLWRVAQETGARPGAALLVAFDLERAAAGTEFLLLGCAGKAAVLVNDRPVFALLGGNRSLLRNQEVVALPLNAGRNTVQVVFDRGAWERVPVDHFAPEWAATLEYAADAETAWRGHAAHVVHPVVDPVVAEYGALRVEAAVPGHEQVELFDLDGVRCAVGRVAPDLSIHWADGACPPPAPFVGWLVVGGEMGEAVLVTGAATVDQLSATVEQQRGRFDPDAVWVRRLRHLLSVNFLRERGLSWRRNVALDLTMAAAERSKPAVAAVLACSKPARIECGTYASSIDGTTQHYLLFRCRQAETAPLAVIFPAVPTVLRPFLESGAVVNQRGAEFLATIAELHGVNLLWPGVADVDYGGALLRRSARECVDAATRDLGPRWQGGIYAVGQCSSGVAALGYARAGHPLQGILLHDPIVSRTVLRWLPKVPQFPTGFSREAGKREQVGPAVAGLPHLPVQLIFDIDSPGHGDREGSRVLVEDLLAAGFDVTANWPQPYKNMIWGERAKSVAGDWFEWILRQEAKRAAAVDHGAARRRELAARPAETVKEALLEGFALQGATDPRLRDWAEGWQVAYSRYRGAAPSGGGRAATAVGLRPLTAAEAEPGRLLPAMPGVSQLGRSGVALGPMVQQAEALFGYALRVAAPGDNRVEVFRAGAPEGDLPQLDLMLDGCCRAALWARRDGRWSLVDFWL